jgi:hypothetical protein
MLHRITSHRRLGRALVAAVVAAGALPAGATAATLEREFDDETLRYRGTKDERNLVSVREVAGALIVTDAAGLFHVAAGDPRLRCVSVDRQTMRCPTPRRFELRLGNGDDAAGPVNTGLPVEINGEAGNDTYQAGNPSFLTNVEFRGGRGVEDTVTYAGSQGATGGQGVRITNDGQPNDGRPGLDTDNVGRDVETLIGSALRDEITANGALEFSVTGEFAHTSVRAGKGDDVLRVGAIGTNVIFKNGPVADGADKIVGGPVPSQVDYGDRSRPVNATLNSDGADDGEAGERDEILGGHEVLAGGEAGDVLRAPAGSRAAHSISGRGGNDQIDGADGADTLLGGAGGDTIRAFGGDDRILLKDGEADTVSCGDGSDTVDVDPIDNFGGLAPLCENGTIGVLRLAPKALRARAGETAQVRLSWRHPRSWKQLRRVTLRLYRGDARVGEVAISPRSRHILDRGGVTVLRRSTRLVHKGTTVSARLALRLDRSLAGRRLRVEVEAVDARGARQLERHAGSIRVAR